MRAIVQRVSRASVEVDGKIVGSSGRGILVFIGIAKDDTESDIEYITDKILNMRIFTDHNDKMNLSLLDLDYEILIISQFTLYGDVRKGRRPSFTDSANSVIASNIYKKFVDYVKYKYKDDRVSTGIFQADMKVDLVNDGPVTILLDSRRLF